MSLARWTSMSKWIGSRRIRFIDAYEIDGRSKDAYGISLDLLLVYLSYAWRGEWIWNGLRPRAFL